MMSKYRFLGLISALMMMFSFSATANDRVQDAEQLVLSLVERIQETVVNDMTAEQIRAETNLIIDEYFDYNLVARFAAGQAWRKATQDEKDAYKSAFREVLLSLAETQFGYFINLEYEAKASTAKGKKLVVVRGMVHDKTGQLPDTVIAWRVSTKDGKPVRIIDIEVENISMVITQQQEHTAIIRQNGGAFSALISALEKMAQDIKKGEQASE